MNHTTPTLPTVIITPSTPLNTLPTRSTRASYTAPSSPSAGRSSRQYSRRQHLLTALELGSSPFPHPDISEEKPDHALLLPSPSHFAPTRKRRRNNGLLLSLLVFAMFGLVLVGPMLPYRWYAGSSGMEVPAFVAAVQEHEQAEATVLSSVADTVASEAESMWDAHGAGQQTEREASAIRRDEGVRAGHERRAWRWAVRRGWEMALLD
jgi:hypothetical protein